MKKKVLLVGCDEDNYSVIDFYMKIVETVFHNKEYEIRYVTTRIAHEYDKSTPVFVVTCSDAVKWRIKGFKNIIFWSQGIIPEESRLRHNSTARYIVLSLLEKYALQKSKVCLFVSHYQCEYYENKYRIKLKEKAFFMPCYNCEIEESSFQNEGKYLNNVFCYVGSLAKWQCFDETVDYFKNIQKKVPNAELRVFTPSIDEARQIIKDKGIINAQVKYVKQEHLSDELRSCKFGFIIREDIAINNVATPTKLSTYLSNGLIPIVSKCIKEFELMLNDLHYKVILNNNQDINEVVSLSEENIECSSVLNEYKMFYDRYYNTSLYVKYLSGHIEKIMQL